LYKQQKQTKIEVYMGIAANNGITVNNQAPANPVLHQVSQIFQNHYRDQQFINKVRAYGSFTCTLQRGQQVAGNILNNNAVITLTTANLGGNVIAQTNLNTRTITFDLGGLTLPINATAAEQRDLLRARVKTLMHEYVHTLGYKHAGNGNNWFNKKSAPYKVAEIFVQDLISRNIL
jgi:predicted Zn-dependent protease